MTTKTFTLALVLIAGCLKSNPNYIGDGGLGSGIDAGSGSGSGPGSGSGCTSDATCSGTTPVCNTSGVCVACSSDADCPTGSPTCVPTGACEGDTDVAYVTGIGADTGTCPLASPCATVGYALVNTTKSYVVLTGPGSDNGIAITRAVEVLGRGSASITANTGSVVTVSGAVNAGLYSVEVFCKAGSVIGITSSSTGTVTLGHDKIDDCAEGGIITTGGTLMATRSEIFGNTGGGVSLTSTAFHIENCLIHDNGTGSGGGASNFGGISITSSPSANDTIAFTTIASNNAMSTSVGGVLCNTQSNALMFSSNIIANNSSDGALETFGNCAYQYTDFFPAGAFQTGTGNGSGDPLFMGGGDFHITTGSPAIDAADPSATLKIDYYGDPRPHGMYCDMGADEFE